MSQKNNIPLSCVNNIIHFYKKVGTLDVCMYCGDEKITVYFDPEIGKIKINPMDFVYPIMND